MNRLFLKFCMSFVLVVASVAGGSAGKDPLAGRWSGSGSASFGPSGKERIKCRATYSRVSSSSYRMRAKCSNGATRVSQSAELSKISDTKYSGKFHNYDYGISGSIVVRLDGRRQNVTLRSEKGSAKISLRRR